MKSDFFDFLKKHEKYAPFMKMVKSPHGDITVPKIVCAVMPDNDGDERSKVKLVNEMLVDFAASMKLAKPGKGSCPYLQPSTQCQYLRSLLAGMKDDYGWDFTLDQSFNFKGGVKTVLDHLFQKRRKDYNKVSVATVSATILLFF